MSILTNIHGICGNWIAYTKITNGMDPEVYHRRQETCPTCKFSKNVYMAHSFVNGTCTVCKYKQKTTITPTPKPTKTPRPTGTPKPDGWYSA